MNFLFRLAGPFGKCQNRADLRIIQNTQFLLFFLFFETIHFRKAGKSDVLDPLVKLITQFSRNRKLLRSRTRMRKYILHYGQIRLVIWTNAFDGLGTYIFVSERQLERIRSRMRRQPLND